MMETLSFGWATLTWWTWPLLVVTVVGSVWLAWLVTLWQERRHERTQHHGKYPCLRHVETVSVGELYCGMLDGHDGDCGELCIGSWAPLPGELHGK